MFIPAVVRANVLVVMLMLIGCGFSEDVQRRQDAIPAPSVSPSAMPGTYLAHGAATVADDLESGTFELTTTDDRPVTGSWIC